MTTLYNDLRSRWKPSDDAIAAANDAFAADPDVDVVLSGHFLVGKEFGIWTADVELLHADAVHPTIRDYAAASAARTAAAVDGAKVGGERPGTVGYTYHYRDGTWATFEEILEPAKLLKYATR